MRRQRLFPSILLPILLTALASGCGFGDRPEILLLVRGGDPLSHAIAEAYAKARNIPTDRILQLTLSTDRRAIEIDAETYLREIAAPIERHLKLTDPDGEITILITTRGLPLRIGSCDATAPEYPRKCQSAALDAALAQLGRTGEGAPAFARTENPFFRDPRSFARFRRDLPRTALRFLVARLSAAPDSTDAGRAAPRAIQDLLDRPPPPESASPPLWRVVSDNPRNDRSVATSALFDEIEDRLPLFGHHVCDGCPAPRSNERASGIVLQSEPPPRSSKQEIEPLAYPGVVIRLDGASVPPGAKGSPLDRLTTLWFARGAGAISTHLADPGLAGVTRPTEQLAALARGHTAIEAHFKSVPQLGWMNVFVGDPLLTLPEESVLEEDARDQDHDGVPDPEDNCRDDSNADQRDTNDDGLGNLCDPDVDDDGRVDTSWGAIYPVDRRGDLEAITLTARNGPYDENHDLDGDGRVDERDLIRARLWLFRTPGRPAERRVIEVAEGSR
ncbi:MAG: hypothetical protein GY910_16465 [bacterium]|nr:hypothetical protein [bacterium]